MSAHTCDEDETYAEDCVACQAAYAKEEAYHRARYHPALRPLEPGTPWRSREDYIRDYDKEET